MHCASCANTLTKAFTELKGVKKASVEFATKTATIEHEQTLTLSDLKTVVKKAGYGAA